MPSPTLSSMGIRQARRIARRVQTHESNDSANAHPRSEVWISTVAADRLDPCQRSGAPLFAFAVAPGRDFDAVKRLIGSAFRRFGLHIAKYRASRMTKPADV